MARFILLLLSVSVLSSCASLRGLRDDGDQTPFIVHTVQYSGETLGIIALWYTGNPRNWKGLQAFNPELNFRRIQMGAQIRIPAHVARKDRSYGQHEFASLFQLMHPAKQKRVRMHFASQSTTPSSFYPVNSIAGCETFDNSSMGLSRCATVIDKLIEQR